MTTIDASVVIPTYNRRESLLETLATLAQQSYPFDRFEVIVVDDGSTDGTEAVARESIPFTLRYIRQLNQGSAAARNTGAQHSHGRILIFIDDDVLVGPDYIAGLLEEHESYERVVAMATYRPYQEKSSSMFQTIQAPIIASNENQEESHGFVPFTSCMTNNLSVEREAFFAIGMMHNPCGDGPATWGDVEFGYRAFLKGFRFRRSVRAVCCHRDYGLHSLAAHCAKRQRQASLAVLMFQKHPTLFPEISMFQDKAPISWRLDPPGLIARKLARHLASSTPTLRGMEWLVNILERRYPSPAALRRLYRWIIAGYVFRGFRMGLGVYGSIPRATRQSVIQPVGQRG
jgi:glycosyltransferase involved in cell wall biosynthesis